MTGSRAKTMTNLAPEFPQWTDISISDVDHLPLFAKENPVTNPRFLARSHHSQVYLLDIQHKGRQRTAILKLFPKPLKGRYTKEVNAYRFLYHYKAVSEGIVPEIYGILPSIRKKDLDKLLQDSMPE